MIQGRFYTLGETADLLKVNRITIRRWLQAGQIEGERVGNMVLFNAYMVDRLKEQREE